MIADANASNHEPSLAELRHTAAHVLAYAVQDLFPEAKPTIGPAIENGFYYDFDRAEAVHARRSRAPGGADERDRRGRLPDDRARGHPAPKRSRAFAGNPYKVEIAREIPEGEPITLYTIGDFTDLCRGGHADSTGQIGAFKLTSVAGAYWRGDEHNPHAAAHLRHRLVRSRAARRVSQRRSKRRNAATIASSAPSSTSSRSKRTPAAVSSSGIRRARSSAASSKTSFERGLRERGYQPVVHAARRSTNGFTRFPDILKTSRRTCSDRSKSRDSASGSSR